MIRKKIKKFLTCITISMLLFTNILTILPSIINPTYASGADLETQSIVTQNPNVTFDVVFIDGKHSMVQNMGSEPIIELRFQSTGGTLSDIKISFRDLNDTTDVNYQLSPNISGSGFTPTVDTTNKTITLNTTIQNQSMKLQMPLRIYSADQYKLEYLNKTTKVVLNAVYTDNSGNQTTINHEIKINLAWQEELVMQIGQRIDRYIPYDIDGKKGVLVEIAIVAKLNLEGMYGTLPIKQTSLEIAVPQFAGVDPTSVEVIATRLLATNGETISNTTFGTNNWNHDTTTRKINITVQNTETNGYLYAGGGSDEFVITYDYPEAAYNFVDWTNGVSYESNVYGQMQYYSGSTVETTSITDNDVFNLKEQIGLLETGPMGKQLYYLNSIDHTNNAKITGQQTHSLHMTDGGDLATHAFVFHYTRFKDAEGNEYSTYVDGVPYVIYNATRINKETFERVLGIDGYIKIYDDKQNYLGTIDTDSPLDSNGYYTYNYTQTLGSVILETSVPIDFTNTLVVIHDTTTLPTLPYTREQIRDFTIESYPVDNYRKLVTATDYEFMINLDPELELEDTISNAYLDIINPTLREAETNKDVTFRITLINDDLESDLYVNPIFQIDLPNYIEEINIKDINFLSGKYFEIEDYEVIKRTDGGFSIKIVGDGTQNRIWPGTQIEVITDITTKQVIPKITEEVEMLYYNEHAKNYKRETENQIDGLSQTITKVGLATSEINFVGTNDLQCYSTITNFDETDTELSSITSKNVGQIAVTGEERTAKMNLNILNGYINSCKDIVILGRIPFQNNKYTISSEGLGSTFSTELVSQITTLDTDVSNRMTVYYSENEEATQDLTLDSNGWTTEYTANNNFKSYLIVLTDYELMSGNSLKFSYDFKIPADLEYEKEVYANFGVYYTKEEQTESKETEKVGLVTQQPPEISINKTVSVGNNTAVSVGDIIKYTITVSNTGEVDAKNLIIRDTIPEGTVYVERTNGIYQRNENMQEIVEEIETLQVGESKEIEFEVEITKAANAMTQIRNIATVEGDGIETPIQSPEVINPVTKQLISITKTSSFNENTYIKEGQNFEYYIKVENISGMKLEELTVTDILAEGITYINARNIERNLENGTYTETTQGITYDAQTRTVTWNIDTLEIDKTVELKIVVKANQITDNSDSKEIENKATITGDEINRTTPKVINKIANIDVDLKKEIDIQEYRIKEGTDITYTITLKNNSLITLTDLTITDELSDLIEFKDAYIIGENGEQIKQGVQYNQASHTVTWEIDEIEEKQEIKVEIKATTKTPVENEEIFNNIATVTGDEIDPTNSNKIEKAVIKEGAPESEFDLAVEKTMKKISVKNSKEDYTNTYNGNKTVKIEISNKLINETTIEIEYEITVINQGNIPGYAKKIVDYMPAGVTFNSEDNPGWLLENGNLYYTGLENEEIKPGENKTISLTLVKQTNENNIGNIINSAEIYEDYNSEGLKDINSTPNNQDEKENDFSKAEVVISIQTGKAYIYIELIIASLGILATGIIFIKKKVI